MLCYPPPFWDNACQKLPLPQTQEKAEWRIIDFSWPRSMINADHHNCNNCTISPVRTVALGESADRLNLSSPDNTLVLRPPLKPVWKHFLCKLLMTIFSLSRQYFDAGSSASIEINLELVSIQYLLLAATPATEWVSEWVMFSDFEDSCRYIASTELVSLFNVNKAWNKEGIAASYYCPFLGSPNDWKQLYRDNVFCYIIQMGEGGSIGLETNVNWSACNWLERWVWSLKLVCPHERGSLSSLKEVGRGGRGEGEVGGIQIGGRDRWQLSNTRSSSSSFTWNERECALYSGSPPPV